MGNGKQPSAVVFFINVGTEENPKWKPIDRYVYG